MKRITISLPDEMADRVVLEAARTRTSTSHVVRKAIEDHLELASCEPRHIPFAGIGHSGHRDTSERIDEILAEGWADAISRHR